MYNISVLLHIFGASTLFFFVGYSIFSVVFNKLNNIKSLFYILGFGLVFQAISGSIIELTSAHPALFISFCSKIIVYFAIVLGTQAMLLIKMKNTNVKLSFRYMMYTSALSILAMVNTGMLLR